MIFSRPWSDSNRHNFEQLWQWKVQPRCTPWLNVWHRSGITHECMVKLKMWLWHIYFIEAGSRIVQPRTGIKKKVEAQLCHMPMNVVCMSFRLYFHRPAIHIDYQITCNVYQCIMIFLFVSHQRPPIQFWPFIIKLSTPYSDRNFHFRCQHDHLLLIHLLYSGCHFILDFMYKDRKSVGYVNIIYNRTAV